MSYTYMELITILNAAESWFKHKYDVFEDEDDKKWAKACNEIKQEIFQSKANFFKLEEDNPF